MNMEKAIWLFAGGAMQEPAARKITELGYKLILTDKNAECTCAKYADEIVEIDTFDIQKNLEAARKLKTKYVIVAVLTTGADCHETVASVAQELRLTGLEPKVSNLCRYKQKTRDLLTKVDIPQPKYGVFKTRDDAVSFAKTLGKAAIKATNNSGSRGFALLERSEDLTKEVFEEALKAGTTGQVIVEEVLVPADGVIAEQSVETIWQDGKMYWLNWVDRLFRKDLELFKNLGDNPFGNWGIELGHINPALHEFTLQREVHDLLYRAGLALGMTEQKGAHILKADIMLVNRGQNKKTPIILELTPRLSGGWDSSASTPARGADFVGGALQLALGKRLTLDLWQQHFNFRNPNLFAAVMAYIPPGAKDCIGRKFSLGSGFDREAALFNAINNVRLERYLPQHVSSAEH